MIEESAAKQDATKQDTAKPVKKSVFVLLVGVLFRPKVTFGYLKDNHKKAWWLPALLILVLTAAPLWAAARPSSPATVMSPDKMETITSFGPRMAEEMPLESSTSVVASSGLNFLKLGGAILGTIAAWLLWGGALYLASVFLGRSSSFGQMFRLEVWTWLPYGIRGLVQTIYILMTGAPIVNAGLSGFVINQAAASPIAPGPGQLALASILGGVDVYLIWHLILISVGLMAFTGLKYRKALTAVLAIWLVFALLGIVPAIFGGMLGGVASGPASGGGIG
jgi:hypothetical protein